MKPTTMSPVAKHIRRTFEDLKAYDEYQNSYIPYCKPTPMCSRVPFEIWMNDYLFPELLQLGNVANCQNGNPLYNWACYFLPEETILRIMCEAGILD